MRNKSFYYPLMIAMLLLLCTPFVTVVYAQSFTVTGTVADSQGGVPGVNVKVKGSTTGTITDMDGKFTLNVPSSKSVLVISYIGYTTQEIPVNNQKILNINLKEDTKVLDEVVVVGYGVQKKSHLTGSVSKMDVNNLTDIPVTQVDQLLQGKIAGVNIRTPLPRPELLRNPCTWYGFYQCRQFSADCHRRLPCSRRTLYTRYGGYCFYRSIERCRFRRYLRFTCSEWRHFGNDQRRKCQQSEIQCESLYRIKVGV